MKLFHAQFARLTLGLACCGPLHAVELQPVDSVLLRIKAPPVTAAAQQPSDAVKLLREVEDFRHARHGLSADAAAQRWLVLWERASGLDNHKAAADYQAYDVVIQRPVGLASVVSVLPPASSWAAIRKEVTMRLQRKPGDRQTQALALLAEVLTADITAARHSLAAIERQASGADPALRDMRLLATNRARALLDKLYGSRQEIADGFRSGADRMARQGFGSLEVPDLVGLVGEAGATPILREVLLKPVTLDVPQGAATQLLARELALKEIKRLRKPQWGLVNELGTAGLYEAMRRRFDPAAEKSPQKADDADEAFDFYRQQADTYYFLDLVLAGRHADAERALLRAAGRRDNISVPKRAMNELSRVGKGSAVYAFLAQALERKPELPVWDLYIEQAGALGHSDKALALLDRVLNKPELTPHLRFELQMKRLDALLGDDRIDEAVAGFRALLLVLPSADDLRLEQRSRAALRLAALGRVVGQPTLSNTGLAFALTAVRLSAADTRGDWRSSLSTELVAELRREGRFVEAQSFALEELERDASDPRYAGLSALVIEPSKRAALVELMGLYDAAGRPADVMRMLDQVGTWGARDLRSLLIDRDSLGTPVGLMAARALKATGQGDAARGALLALIEQMPGYDAAYRAFVDLDPEKAVPDLERLYSQDQFEERPLIWKARALSAGRQWEAAERAVRQAITIDPSDGEQGAGDRMRAYAVLADLLETRGDAKGAAGYRRAVAAIRRSEQADELRKLGLHRRAFAAYRAALDEFSDAYCIQSRLAVQLGKLGLQEEALKHYRRAFELMPDSFGRVESHCFGCESVFAASSAQRVAEQVFTGLLQRGNSAPQAAYMLGYLRMEQGRYDEAVVLFRRAVALDPDYLNAWKQLHMLSDKTYIDAKERDGARLRLFQLDPRQWHAKYRLNEVSDFAALSAALLRFEVEQAQRTRIERIYPLEQSARDRDAALAGLPADMRAQFEKYVGLQDRMSGQTSQHHSTPVLSSHALVQAVLGLASDSADGPGYND